MAENIHNTGKESHMQNQKAHGVSNRVNPKRPTSRHIVIKKAKVKKTTEGNKRNIVSYILRKPHKAIS